MDTNKSEVTEETGCWIICFSSRILLEYRIYYYYDIIIIIIILCVHQEVVTSWRWLCVVMMTWGVSSRSESHQTISLQIHCNSECPSCVTSFLHCSSVSGACEAKTQRDFYSETEPTPHWIWWSQWCWLEDASAQAGGWGPGLCGDHSSSPLFFAN